MSDIADVAAGADSSGRIERLGAVIVACWAQAIFAGALVLAVMKILPAESILLLLGAVIANAQQAASFFLGSSAGSKAKDQQIAAQSTQLAQSAPQTRAT